MSDNSAHRLYVKVTAKKLAVVFVLLLALIGSIVAAICIGPVNIPPQTTIEIIFSKISPFSSHTNTIFDTIVIDVRIPRVLMALLAGMCLSTSGAVMQGVLRNPLASPYILGVAAGAAFGAALSMILGIGEWLGVYSVYLMAFIFAFVAIFLVYGLSKARATTTETLILAGIAVGAMFNAFVSLLMYVSGESLRSLVFWIMGGLWTSSWGTVIIILPVAVVGSVLLFGFSWDLNVMTLGDEAALSLGVNVKRRKVILLILSTLLAAIVISATGIIGFIGLVAPHIARMVIGTDYRLLLPTASLMGMLLLLLADTFTRTIVAPTEIPVGIITTMIGVPFFAYLLIKSKRSFWT